LDILALTLFSMKFSSTIKSSRSICCLLLADSSSEGRPVLGFLLVRSKRANVADSRPHGQLFRKRACAAAGSDISFCPQPLDWRMRAYAEPPIGLARLRFCAYFMTNHFLFQAVVFLVFSILLSMGSIAHPAIVVIDPGHGGRDRGGIPGQKLAEKVFTLDTGKRLARILRANGDIRPSAADVRLTQRVVRGARILEVGF